MLDDDEGIILPKNVVSGHIIRMDEDGNKRYDFQFENKRGYKVTIEGLSEKFNKEYWNYAKLISGVLRYRTPSYRTGHLVGSPNWTAKTHHRKNGGKRALKKYIQDGRKPKARNAGTAVTKHWFTKKVASSARRAELHAVDNPNGKHKRLHRNLNDLDNGSCNDYEE